MRILFLTHRLPYAPNRGDRIRAYYLLKRLRRSADVDLVSLVHDAEEASHVDDACALASTVHIAHVQRARSVITSLLRLPGSRPTTHTMLDAPDLQSTIDSVVRTHSPSVVLAYCSGMARVAIQPPLDRIPMILDMVDVDSAKWAILANRSAPPHSWLYRREARLLARFEQNASRRAFATLVTTENEWKTLRVLAPDARLEIIQNGVEVEAFRPAAAPVPSETAMFCGVMNYAPNEEGAVWLARHVWPIVRRARPNARLQLVGSHPTRTVQNLARTSDGIEVTGYVDDVRRYLWRAAVAVAPLLTARGVQNKVLEAVASGLPAVVTPVVYDGLPQDVHAACWRADGADHFARAILTLLGQTPEERRGRALQANIDALSWERTLERVPALLAAAAATHSGSAVHCDDAAARSSRSHASK